MQHAWILSTGTELVLGQSVDTNSAWLASRLAELGMEKGKTPPTQERIEETVIRASQMLA